MDLGSLQAALAADLITNSQTALRQGYTHAHGFDIEFNEEIIKEEDGLKIWHSEDKLCHSAAQILPKTVE